MDNLRELYQQVILDHNRNPRNCGVLEHANHQAEGVNPLCGDQLTVYLQIKNNIIEKACFVGTGCAISMASASLMTEALEGKTRQDAAMIFSQFHDTLINENPCSTDLGKLAVLTGVREYPSRVKCATLAWHAMNAALDNKTTTVTTE